MGVSDILASVDREIALLKQVRALLSDTAAPKKKAGRPRKIAAVVAPVLEKPAKTAAKKKKKRNLSPEGRKRIAEAVKRRWEAQKKAAASK
jgi:uroporphyrinogen-III decarboxylase